jgi:hypothetical protein
LFGPFEKSPPLQPAICRTDTGIGHENMLHHGVDLLCAKNELKFTYTEYSSAFSKKIAEVTPSDPLCNGWGRKKEREKMKD